MRSAWNVRRIDAATARFPARRNAIVTPRLMLRRRSSVVVIGGCLRSPRCVHEAWKAAVIRAVNANYTNVPASGHYMTIDAPEFVINAVIGVLDAVEQQ
jgi:pimeloyl-ACP methyl ester carboxylesterase